MVFDETSMRHLKLVFYHVSRLSLCATAIIKRKFISIKSHVVLHSNLMQIKINCKCYVDVKVESILNATGTSLMKIFH